MALKRSVEDMVAEAKGRVEELSVDDLAREMAEGDPLVVDIRDIRELLERGAVPGSVHAPRGMLEFWVDPKSPYFREHFADPDRRTIVYCAAGGRSALAADTLQQMGFTDVAHLEAGFNGWKEADRPVEDVAATSKWVRRS